MAGSSSAASTLAAAAAELGGAVIRTPASVIGQHAGESVIVATAGWGYTVTAVLQGMRMAFTVRPRGFLRRCLKVEGRPVELVSAAVDAEHLDRLAPLAPLLVELNRNGLRLEHRYGAAGAVVDAIHVVCSLARRARSIEDRFAGLELSPAG